MRYLYEYKNVKAENFSVRGIKKRRIGVPEQLDFPEIVALQDMIGIKMNDFIIVGEDEYLSFKDEHIVL